jgi:hypothetical protein
MGFDCVFADVKVLTQLPVAHTSRQERQQFPLGVAHSAYSPTSGEKGRREAIQGPPSACAARFGVSRRGPRRQENPRPAGAGSANPGFYAESGEFHSEREPTPEVNPKHGPQRLATGGGQEQAAVDGSLLLSERLAAVVAGLLAGGAGSARRRGQSSGDRGWASPC